MSIFSKKEVIPEPITGIDTLRQAVAARMHKAGVLHALARDVAGARLSELEDFVQRKRVLQPAVLAGLAKEIFDARLDENDMLVSLNQKLPTPLCAANYPPRIDPKTSPYYSPPPRDHDAVLARMPRPVNSVPAKPKGPPPGWADGGT